MAWRIHYQDPATGQPIVSNDFASLEAAMSEACALRRRKVTVDRLTGGPGELVTQDAIERYCNVMR